MMSKLARTLIPARWRPIRYLETLVWNRTGRRVRSGPFAETKYVFGSIGSAFIPKILGIYEREISPFVERAVRTGFDRVIDVGAAEGYYAVGLALRCPSARVIAYEMDPAGRAALTKMAAENGAAGRIDIRGRCEPEHLAADLNGRPALVVCDCEGYEATLLDPTRVPGLARATILVEVHDFIVPGIGDELAARFAPTHTVERVWQTERSGAEFPYRTLYTRWLPRRYLEWAVSEWRPERMSWLWMTPKSVVDCPPRNERS